jgi:hypothetical protein
MRYAELRLIYDVMSRFKEKGLRGMSRDDQRIYREIADLEYEEKRSKR